MAVESAADIASFFDEDEWAEAALYTGPEDGAEPVACTVIVDRGQGRTQFAADGRQVSSAERLLHVQASQVTPRRKGTFVLLDVDGEPTGEEIEVAGSPRLDEAGAIWTSELVIRG